MDYEKKYKEALEVARRKLCFDKAGMVDSFTPNDIYEMFPELKESDDEKIRKELIGFLRNIPNSNYTCEEMALWLEKQGTRPRYNIGDVICDKSCTTLNKEAQPNMAIVDIQNGMYICDKGSFPVSQQDEYVLVGKKIDSKLNDDSVSNELRTASFAHAKKEILNHTFPNNEEFELAYTFEEGAKWDAAQKSTWSEKYIADVFEKVGLAKIAREQSNDALTIALQDAMIELSKVTLQPNPTAWSEEDESWFKEMDLMCLYFSKDTDYRAEFSTWLKFLKDRYTWKPSDAQMIALNDVITNGKLSNANERILKGLQEQLKKLK